MNKEVFSSYYFLVEVDGLQSSRFFECDGIEMETEVIEVEEGASIRKFPGKTKIKNIVLRKGISKDNELFHWYQSFLKGTFEKKTISVILMDFAHREVQRYDFLKAFSCRWKGPRLDVQDNSFATEMIEIAFG